MPASEIRTLRVEFSTEASFRGEYSANIANGGIFIATRSSFSAREAVLVEVSLGFLGESVILDGEVVHIIPAELAATGATPGVAVQFGATTRDLRQRFEALVGPAACLDEAAQESGRRCAPRARARVPTCVVSEREGRVLGRTRNVSETGVLLSVEGTPAPVGSEVEIAIVDPNSGEELVVPAQVARHVEGEAGVTAIAVRFDEQRAQQAGVSRFLKDLESHEHRRQLGGIEGAVSEVGIEHLLQMFGACAPRGTLTVMRGGDEGRVVFEDGRLREARVGPLEGLPALSRLLSWRDGRFEFSPAVDPGSLPDDALPLDGAVLHAMALLDESRREAPAAVEVPVAVKPGVALGTDPLEARADPLGESDDPMAELAWEIGAAPTQDPPPGARLGIDPAAVAAARGALCKVEAAVVELAAAGSSVARLLSIIPEPEASVRAALRDLIERGIVLVAE